MNSSTPISRVRTIISVLLSADKRLCQRGGWYDSVGHLRIDATLWEGEEEVEVCIYPRGEDDNIDNLFAEVVNR